MALGVLFSPFSEVILPPKSLMLPLSTGRKTHSEVDGLSHRHRHLR